MSRRALPLAALFLLVPAMLPSCALRISTGMEVRVHATLGESAVPGVALSRARLSLDEITLVPCADGSEARRWTLSSVAFAHHATVDGRSLLESQVGLGERTDLGRLTPPPGRYCAVELIVAPGRAAPLDGETVTAELTRPRPAALRASGNRLFEVPIEPLELGADSPRADLTIHIGLADALSQLDLALAGDDLALDLLVALPEHVAVSVALPPPS